MSEASTGSGAAETDKNPAAGPEPDVRKRSATLRLVDGHATPGGDGIVAFWSRKDVPAGQHSIPALVDRSAVSLRRQYLEWVYYLGCASVDGTDLKNALLFEGQSVSYWWMNRIAEKSPIKIPAIYDVLRVRSLELLYEDLECQGLEYCGADERLSRALAGWCREIGHPYRWTPTRSRNDRVMSSSERFLRYLPYLAQGIVFLCWSWWQRHRHRRRSGNPAGEGVTIVTYFPNYDEQAAARDRFRSRFLGRLHDLLDTLPHPVNWVWIYSESDQASYRDAALMRDKFNRAARDSEHFYLLEDFVTSRDLVRALALFARLARYSRKLESLRERFQFAESRFNFFPLLEHDWRSSVSGTTAMETVLFSLALDRMAQTLPIKPWGLFVWEGQGWESALTGAWRRFQEGRIIGYQHSALRPMDFHSYDDSRVLTGSGPAERPVPDLVAVNGEASMRLMLETGWPSSGLRMVEATRYGHLSAEGFPRSAAPAALLVVTGIIAAEARFQLGLLDSVPDLGADYPEIWVKPHPYCPVDAFLGELSASGSWKFVDSPLEELLPYARCAFVAASTAAVIDVLYAGVPAIVCADGKALNLSPAFGMLGVPAVADPDALARALSDPPLPPPMSDYLNLNPGLSAWQEVLA